MGVIDEFGNIIYRVDAVRGFFDSFDGDNLTLLTDEGLCVYDRDGKKYNLSRHVVSSNIKYVGTYKNNLFEVAYGKGGVTLQDGTISRETGFFKLIFKGNDKNVK
jgi:hypothetical protein